MNGSYLKFSKESITCTTPGSFSYSSFLLAESMPIVLMSDHQTVGGYAKIATVIGCDVSLLAQARPGDAVRFVPITVQEAEKIARQQEKWLDNLLFW